MCCRKAPLIASVCALYMPVVFPGFSWQNLKKSGKPSQIQRLRGEFLWRQAYNAKKAGAAVIRIAVFDEVDEGTAVIKVVSSRAEAPDQGSEITRMFHSETEPDSKMVANPGAARPRP